MLDSGHTQIIKENTVTVSHNFHLVVKKESRIFHPQICLFVLRIILGSLFIYLLTSVFFIFCSVLNYFRFIRLRYSRHGKGSKN